MGTSGVANFNPGVTEATLLAFSRCGKKRDQLTPEMLADARMETNLLLSEWSNDQPHLWEVDLQTINLTGGENTYDLPPDTILVLDAYYRVNTGAAGTGWGSGGWGQGGWGASSVGANLSDRILWSISRSEYAAYPDKGRQSPPTVFWFNRTDPPQIITYPTPQVKTTDQIQYYRVKRIQDAFASGGQTANVTYRYIAALADGLTANLAIYYAPDMAAAWQMKYQRTLKAARMQDRVAVMRSAPKQWRSGSTADKVR